jgi:hypothetical protein
MPRHKYGKKPKNFPARVNARRVSALHRIDAQLSSGEKQTSLGAEPLTAADRARLNREGNALALRIHPEAALRAIRTKKDRSGTGKFSRA